MNKLLLHPSTKIQLASIQKNLPHALLLIGKKGIGLKTIAHSLSSTLTNKNSIITITPDEKQTIKTEQIRNLYDYIRVSQANKLIVLINEAEVMQASAQNALLKLLEEPPRNVFFIVTSYAPQLLLSTVRSRLQEINILPITPQQTKELINSKLSNDPKKVAQLLFLASGLPAEILHLLSDDTYFALRSEQTRQARDFILQPLYQKLLIVSKINNDRLAALSLVKDATLIIEKSLASRPTEELALKLESLLLTEEKLRNDGHVKTQLLRFSVF